MVEKDDNKDRSVDVGSIASAVARELARINKSTDTNKDKDTNKDTSEVFKCPDCGATVSEGARICGVCGCELEWGE